MLLSIIIPVGNYYTNRFCITGTQNERQGYYKAAIYSAEWFKNYLGPHKCEIIIEGYNSLSINVNRALIKSSGKWIKILADDDILLKGLLSQLTAAEFSKNKWLISNAYNFTDMEDLPPGWPQEYKSSFTTHEALLKNNTIHGGTTLYSRKLLFKVGGYDESLDTAEEYDLNLNLTKKGYFPEYVDAFTYKYRLHANQKSSSMGLKLKEDRREFIKNQIKSRYV